MSSTAAAQARRPRWATNPATDALQRARLFLVPRSRAKASKVPFIVLVSALLVGGVVGLLCFNTSMQQAAFSEAKLSQEATDLAAKQESLETQLQRLQNPQSIAARAQAHGMVIPPTPAVLHVPSGKVSGVATPATAVSTPRLWGTEYRHALMVIQR